MLTKQIWSVVVLAHTSQLEHNTDRFPSRPDAFLGAPQQQKKCSTDGYAPSETMKHKYHKWFYAE